MMKIVVAYVVLIIVQSVRDTDDVTSELELTNLDTNTKTFECAVGSATQTEAIRLVGGTYALNWELECNGQSDCDEEKGFQQTVEKIAACAPTAKYILFDGDKQSHGSFARTVEPLAKALPQASVIAFSMDPENYINNLEPTEGQNDQAGEMQTGYQLEGYRRVTLKDEGTSAEKKAKVDDAVKEGHALIIVTGFTLGNRKDDGTDAACKNNPVCKVGGKVSGKELCIDPASREVKALKEEEACPEGLTTKTDWGSLGVFALEWAHDVLGQGTIDVWNMGGGQAVDTENAKKDASNHVPKPNYIKMAVRRL